MLYGIVVAVTALLLSALLAAALRGPALRLGLLDRRRQRAVPLSGGVAVLTVTALVAWLGDWTAVAPLGNGVGRLLVAAVCVGALGLIVDRWRLRWWVPVAGTASAAVAVVPYEDTGVVGGLLAVGWIVGLAAAFRGLDHLDGLAGTVGVVTAFATAACAAVELMDGLAVLLSVLAAALTGFLLHNRHPARVGLGAGGALFAGFVLASAAVFVRAGYGVGSSAGVLLALTAVMCADAVLVVLSRRLARRPVWRGAPDHLGHRLRRLGLAPRGVTLLLGTGALGAAVVGVLTHSGRSGGSGVWWVAGLVLVLVVVMVRVRGPVYSVYGVPGRGWGAGVSGVHPVELSGVRPVGSSVGSSGSSGVWPVERVAGRRGESSAGRFVEPSTGRFAASSAQTLAGRSADESGGDDEAGGRAARRRPAAGATGRSAVRTVKRGGVRRAVRWAARGVVRGVRATRARRSAVRSGERVAPPAAGDTRRRSSAPAELRTRSATVSGMRSVTDERVRPTTGPHLRPTPGPRPGAAGDLRVRSATDPRAASLTGPRPRSATGPSPSRPRSVAAAAHSPSADSVDLPRRRASDWFRGRALVLAPWRRGAGVRRGRVAVAPGGRGGRHALDVPRSRAVDEFPHVPHEPCQPHQPHTRVPARTPAAPGDFPEP